MRHTHAVGIALAATAVLAGGALAAQATGPGAVSTTASEYADRAVTPGATNPAVTQDTIRQTVCVPGWSASVRPPASYTTSLKRAQLKALGYADQVLADYEEDHFDSLEIGGSPTSPLNLWPEPIASARKKDVEENALHKAVCANPPTLTLAAAQAKMREDWSR